MTFTEAAVEVLRLVGKPLHYKKITELAIERNLLSHVGKTPEVTMSSRLATMVKRDRGEVPIIKVKPGVFGLREFTEEQLADLSGDIMELPEVEVENEENGAEPQAEAAEGAQAAERPAPEPRRPLPGADVFPEEEDDDEPILGSPDEDEDDDEDDDEGAERGDAAQTSDSRSARRRRKRRRKGRGEGNGESADEGSELSLRDERRHDRHERRHERHERRNDRHERRDRRDERRDREEAFVDYNREPADGDLLGKDLADAVASVLGQAGPRGFAAYRVADLLVQRGRLAGDPQSLVPTVMAAVRADIARKKIERVRPRFRIEGTSLVLSDFLLPQDVVRAEQEVLRAAERQRERARRAYLRNLSELSNAGLAELLATWLNAEGVVGLRAVRRPGSGPGELHLAGTLRRGVEEVRLAIMVYRDVRELGRERVIEARGVLHYYGNASAAWLITLGNVLGGAREEAQAPASAPVALYDGMALAASMERVGVGLSVQYVPVSALDTELLESLRAPRVDHHRERERARRHEPAPRPVEDEFDEEEELLEDEGLERAAGEVELAEGEAEGLAEGASEGAESAAETAEGREGGRRRRRRRRRRGGRDRDTEAVAALPEGAAEARDWEEGDERADLDRADDEEVSEEGSEDGVEASAYRDELDEDAEEGYPEELSAAEEASEAEEADVEAEAPARPVWEDAEEDAAVDAESEIEEPQAEGEAEEATPEADEAPADELDLYERDR